MPLKNGCRENIREKQLIYSVTRKLLRVFFIPSFNPESPGCIHNSAVHHEAF